MKNLEHLNILMNNYFDDELEHFFEYFEEYKEENFDNHILGHWFKVIENFPQGKEFIDSTKRRIKNGFEEEVPTFN
jgi:hypothetical protein